MEMPRMVRIPARANAVGMCHPWRQQHFGADEHQDYRERRAQVVEFGHGSRQQKIQRTQSQYREDVGSKDNERILSDCKNGGDGIH